jgi:hypothetical protein
MLKKKKKASDCFKENFAKGKYGGACLKSQHLEGEGRRISIWRPTWTTQ